MKKYKHRKTFTFNGKRYEVRGDTLDEVYEKKAQKLQELKTGKYTVSGSTTVRDWTEVCMDTYKPNVSDRVKKDMMMRINKHIVDPIGSLQLKSVTPLDCQRILTNQAHMSHSHVTKLKQEMHFIFETAKKNHLILENPADDLVAPKGNRGKRRSITAHERYHLLKVAESYEPFMLYLLMLYCGCRPSEAIGCKGSDISIVNETPMLHIRGTKTDLSDRFVPIPDKLYPRIKKTPQEAPIAPNTRGREHSESSYDRLLARLRREMNISMGCQVYRNRLLEPLPLAEDFVPYNLRHTYCTDLCKKGVDVRIAQKLMGHSSIQITSDIYTHVDMDDITSVADLINK